MPIIRVSSDVGKPHSTKAGRKAESKRAVKRQFGTDKYARGGTAKGKEGIPGIGRPKNPRDKWKDRIKNMGKRPSLTDILSGGRKGKPHSSKEGRRAAAGRSFRRIVEKQKPKIAQPRPMPKIPKPKRIPGEQKPIDPRSPYIKDRVMTPLRAKKGIGGVIKKGISQLLKPKGVFKPKPKPGKKGLGSGIKPSEAKDILKSDKITRSEYLKQWSPYFGGRSLKKEMKAGEGVHARNKESKKVFKSAKGKAAGGRISRGHGGSAAQQHYLQHGYGPHKLKMAKASDKALRGNKLTKKA